MDVVGGHHTVVTVAPQEHQEDAQFCFGRQVGDLEILGSKLGPDPGQDDLEAGLVHAVDATRREHNLFIYGSETG